MKPNLQFDFNVNKENNTIEIKREFAANLDLVWKAWTTAELLDKWWGPKPCKAKTKSFDFREGGHWLYCMIIPPSLTGNENDLLSWGKQEFNEIVFHQIISGIDYFCDENGNANPEMPKGKFENKFSFVNGKTLVTMISKHDKFEDIKLMIEMGFKEGITTCFNQIDELLGKFDN